MPREPVFFPLTWNNADSNTSSDSLLIPLAKKPERACAHSVRPRAVNAATEREASDVLSGNGIFHVALVTSNVYSIERQHNRQYNGVNPLQLIRLFHLSIACALTPGQHDETGST